jgi:biopolymer transport protein ExbB/TolQ
MDESPVRSDANARSSDWGWTIVSSPYLWGTIATIGFYKGIPYLPAYRDLAERYFCAHPVEYVQTLLLFVGSALLIRSLLRLRTERAAIAACEQAGASSTEPIRAIQTVHQSLAPPLKQTVIGRRLRDLSTYLGHRPSGSTIEDQLKYLHDQAVDRLYDSYALLQTIIWAIPIMGFLGTVLGITMAIFNLDVNNLDESLKDVTFNLAVAFDTTAVALCHSVVLVFANFFVKRADESVLSRANAYGQLRVLPLFPDSTQAAAPLVEAEAAAAKKLIDRTEALIESQTQLWRNSVESLRERWTDTLDAQREQLSGALQTGTQQTLGDHADQLAAARQELVQAVGQLSHELTRQMQASDGARREQDAALAGRLEFFAAQMSAMLSSSQAAADERATRLLSELGARVDAWQSQLQQSTERVEAQITALTRQHEQLAALLEQGGDVVNLQQRLSDNLDALRAAETFEQTMHSLSAAVHLLSANARVRAAA